MTLPESPDRIRDFPDSAGHVRSPTLPDDPDGSNMARSESIGRFPGIRPNRRPASAERAVPGGIRGSRPPRSPSCFPRDGGKVGGGEATSARMVRGNLRNFDVPARTRKISEDTE